MAVDCFFFQAEDGIRDGHVTGVQTCALPISERQNALPTALSSGQRRRLLLAAAFVRPRTLLVLDEPEQRLDSGMRDRLAERLAAEREAGGGVVMATHDRSEERRVGKGGRSRGAGGP